MSVATLKQESRLNSEVDREHSLDPRSKNRTENNKKPLPSKKCDHKNRRPSIERGSSPPHKGPAIVVQKPHSTGTPQHENFAKNHSQHPRRKPPDEHDDYTEANTLTKCLVVREIARSLRRVSTSRCLGRGLPNTSGASRLPLPNTQLGM